MRFLGLAFFLIIVSPSVAYAQCVNPTGNESDVIYNTAYNVPQYCDGNDQWIAMAGTDPTGCPPGKSVCGGKPDERFVFAISNSAPKNYGGIEGADSDCQAAADASGIHGTYYAWIAGSDPNNAPAFRFEKSSVPYVRADGLTIANNWADLTDGTLDNPAGMRISGSTSFFTSAVPTNVAPDGTQKSATDHCNDYSGGSGDVGTSGRTTSTDSGWTDVNTSGCSGASTMYCFEQGNIRRTEVVPNGLVGHWRLDETSGTTAVDSSGNGYDGTAMSGLNATDDSIKAVLGFGLTFDPAQNHYVEMLSGAPGLGNEPEATLCAWAYPVDTNGPYAIISRYRDGSSSPGWSLQIDSDNSTIEFDNDTSSGGNIWQGAPNAAIPQKWSHYCATYFGGGYVRLYVDGVLVGEHTSSIPAVIEDSSSGKYRIGQVTRGRAFNGSLDDVRVYHRALSTEEIQEIYEARDGVRYNESYRVPEFFDGNKWVAMPPPWPDAKDGLVGHWKLDETDGTTAFDNSESGNNGAMLNSLSAGENSRRGAVSGALGFNVAESHYINVGDPADGSLDFGTSAFSFGAWIKPAGFVNQGSAGNIIMGKRGVSLENSWSLQVSSSTFGCHVDSPFVGTPFVLNEWQHVICVRYPNGEVKIFVDGVVADTNSGAIGDVSTNLEFMIGTSDGRRNNRYFNGEIDDVRVYDRPLSPGEIQTLYKMGTPEGSSTALPQGCPNVGDVCDDGTVYAGLSPDGNVEMFTTPEDVGSLTWNDDNTNFTTTGTTDVNTGASNTQTIVMIDSDGVQSGFQKHTAAQYCYDLVAGGADDWYLPAQSELDELFQNRFAIGNFNTSGGFPQSYYYSSTEANSNIAVWIRFDGGSTAVFHDKDRALKVRCVRKGPAPRCANPYGRESDMFYNTTHDVVQYCDGARWVAIGKTSP